MFIFVFILNKASEFGGLLFIGMSIFQEHYQSVKTRTDVLWALIWVQTDCRDYQQTTNMAASKERDGCDYFYSVV